MTDDEIETLAKKHICPHHDRLDAILPNRVPYQQTEQFRRVKALIGDVLSKLRAPVADEQQPDGKRPDLDWIEGVRVTDTLGRGWCVRIDGTDIFEDVNRYGCKGRKSFQIASGLASKQEAERAALEWIDRQRAALTSAPVAGEADQDEMERQGWVNSGYKHDLEKARRAISFCNIPGFETMALDDAIYWLRNQVDNAAPQASEAVNPVDSDAWQGIEQMAATRYRVEPYGIGHKVVAGNGTRTLYTGPKYFCELIAARLTAAFLDGAFAALSAQPGKQKNEPTSE